MTSRTAIHICSTFSPNKRSRRMWETCFLFNNCLKTHHSFAIEVEKIFTMLRKKREKASLWEIRERELLKKLSVSAHVKLMEALKFSANILLLLSTRLCRSGKYVKGFLSNARALTEYKASSCDNVCHLHGILNTVAFPSNQTHC